MLGEEGQADGSGRVGPPFPQAMIQTAEARKIELFRALAGVERDLARGENLLADLAVVV